MVNCCAFGCPNRSERKEDDITFHRIPVHPKKRRLWIKYIRRKDWIFSEYDRICSVHFEEKYFYRTAKMRRLRAKAVPTLFANFPESTHLENREISESELSSDSFVKPKPAPTKRKKRDPPNEVRLKRQLFSSEETNRKKSEQIELLKQSLQRCNTQIDSLKQLKKDLKKEDSIFLVV